MQDGGRERQGRGKKEWSVAWDEGKCRKKGETTERGECRRVGVGVWGQRDGCAC